ncbi:MAG: hypothetical protein J6D26_01035 [Clostridia bacterium]|nr:hypothetical protein [Clostridia bacterium]
MELKLIKSLNIKDNETIENICVGDKVACFSSDGQTITIAYGEVTGFAEVLNDNYYEAYIYIESFWDGDFNIQAIVPIKEISEIYRMDDEGLVGLHELVKEHLAKIKSYKQIKTSN